MTEATFAIRKLPTGIPGFDLIASGGLDRTVRVWDSETGQAIGPVNFSSTAQASSPYFCFHSL